MALPKIGNIKRKNKTTMLDRLLALVLIVVLLPVFLVLSLAILIMDGWPIGFCQPRWGKNKKEFGMWKFRSMVVGAEIQKSKVIGKNEVDGPVFKIYDDPRFTKIGKFLSHTGLDELPQLLNILVGDMALVGPRPLPVDESKKIPRIYESRYRVLPGVISPWVVGGYHKVSFNKWMESDVQYVKNKNLFLDIQLCWMTVGVVWKMFKNELLKIKKSSFS